jgi:phosphoribosylglycinamide formyltransferase 1
MNVPKKRCAILVSGRGSNMMALVEASRRDPDYPAEFVVVISNRPDAPGLAWAQSQGITTHALDHKKFASRELFDGELDRVLKSERMEFVVCAGYLRIMTAGFVAAWSGRMVNIHPSLLPSFKGLHTHERALEAGVKIAGCTVHVVTAEMDEGPILAQAAVPVLLGDSPESLGLRVLAAEHQIFPPAVADYIRSYGTSQPDNNKLNHSVNHDGALFSPALAKTATPRV